MTKRLSRAKLQRITVEVTSAHWKRAKIMCRHDVVTKALPDGTKVKSADTGSNCIIADALVEFLGADVPLKTRSWYDPRKFATVKKSFVDVSVGGSSGHIGSLRYDHNAEALVKAFDSGNKMGPALKAEGIKLPMKVTFTRSK